MKIEQIDIMNAMLLEVFEERQRQNAKWGIQRHDMGEWMKILMEEVGEACQAMQKDTKQYKVTDASNLKKELIQVSAVALAMAEQAEEEERAMKKQQEYYTSIEHKENEAKLEVHKRVKQIRNNMRYTQRHIAEHLGISLNAYQKIENGERNLKTEYLVKLAKFYSVTSDYILGIDK